MAAAGNTRGNLAWVILVAALAVPGVLFYNWWSHLKADREKTVAAKARGRVLDGGGVFQSSPNAKLINPMSAEISTEPATAPAVAQSAQAATITASPAAPIPAAEAPIAAEAPPPAFSAATSSAPPLKRDPTLSPFDQVHFREEDEAKRRAAEELANEAKSRLRGPRAKVSVNPQTMVELQGIVSNPESGFKAIVNGEVVGAGEFVGSTKIKVIKISDLGVTFDYKGKRFSKGVSRD